MFNIGDNVRITSGEYKDSVGIICLVKKGIYRYRVDIGDNYKFDDYNGHLMSEEQLVLSKESKIIKLLNEVDAL